VGLLARTTTASVSQPDQQNFIAGCRVLCYFSTLKQISNLKQISLAKKQDSLLSKVLIQRSWVATGKRDA